MSREMALPAEVRGPVERRALRILALYRLAEGIRFHHKDTKAQSKYDRKKVRSEPKGSRCGSPLGV